MTTSSPRRFRFAVLGLALGLGAALSAFAAPRADTELHDHMMGLKNRLKALSRSLGEEDDAGALDALAEMQSLALAAKALDPANLDEQPDEQREPHRRAFRADMARLLAHLARMEVDVLEGRRDEATALMKGELMALRNGAHERFQPAR